MNGENKPVRPTNEQLAHAIEMAKAAGYTSSQIITEDDAAGSARMHLPPPFDHAPLGTVRSWFFNLSKGGGEPGVRKRNGERSPANEGRSGIARLLRAFPHQAEHSEEYRRLHDSPEFRNRASDEKRAADYRCQCCRGEFNGPDLEAHVLDYRNPFKPGGIWILCRELCHPVIDALRRYRPFIKRGEDPGFDPFFWEPEDNR